MHPEDSAPLLAALGQLVEAGLTEVDVRIAEDGGLRHASLRGKVLDRDRRGRPLRAVGLVLDITAEKAMEEQMLRMALSDGLTGVPNRRSFDKTLSRRLLPGTDAAGAVIVSVGTATWQPEDEPVEHLALLDRADKALHVAKTAGKN